MVEATENKEASTLSFIEILNGSRAYENKQAIFQVIDHMKVLVLPSLYLQDFQCVRGNLELFQMDFH